MSGSMLAGILLLARQIQARMGLPHSTVDSILNSTGAGAAQAYVRRSEILRLVSRLDRPVGRPRTEPKHTVTAALSQRVLRFLMDNPGAVCSTGERRQYNEAFRSHVLALHAEHSSLGLGSFSEAVQVPVSSLRAWLHAQTPIRPPPVKPDSVSVPRELGPIARAWLSWRGSLTRFCDYVQRALALPWKRSRIAALLAEYGLRSPRRRASRPRRGRAPHGSFETFFPGAQWVTDGKRLSLRINGQVFAFNLQLVVDTHSGAILGASLRDCEDGRAVTEAFADAVATAGQPPLALLLDNKACNHSSTVERLRATTLLTYAARGRPQSKGHVEGAFGLFSQAMPELTLHADNTRDLARQFLGILVQGWARTLNHRPRRDRGGSARVALYLDTRAMSAELREVACAALRKRALRVSRPKHGQVLSGQMGISAVVEAWLARLAIPDAGGRIAAALCAYPLDAVLAGMAAYEGKLTAGTLPAEAAGAYLIGIVRSIAKHDEGLHIADALWSVHSRAREVLEEVLEARTRTVATHAMASTEGLDSAIDEAMAASNPCERRLWISAVGRAMRGLERDQKAKSYYRAIRRIHSFLSIPYMQRFEAVRLLAAEMLPVHEDGHDFSCRVVQGEERVHRRAEETSP
ncbi:MAG: hypothetical protein ACJ8AT_06525 [Hyalangium sp.]